MQFKFLPFSKQDLQAYFKRADSYCVLGYYSLSSGIK